MWELIRLGGTMIWREDRYRPVLMRYEASDQLRQIWKAAFQDEYPVKANPFGFVTLRDLNKMANTLGAMQGSLLLDVGCGTGGVGLCIAEQTEARLIGIDLISEAIEIAKEKSKGFNLRHAANFHQQSVCALKFSDCSLDAVMSIDCLWMVLEKSIALKELNRVMKAGSKLVLTTWVPRYLDLNFILIQSGFYVLEDEETPDWKRRQLAVYDGILASGHRLELELGVEATATLMVEASNAASELAYSTRRFIVAEKSEID